MYFSSDIFQIILNMKKTIERVGKHDWCKKNIDKDMIIQIFREFDLQK